MNTKFPIPYFNLPDTPLTGTAQDHLPLAAITEDLALFKDGGAALIMESTSLNFSLLSEREQEAVVAAYAALINSLSFAVQILVRTQKKDVSVYLEALDRQIPKVQNPKLKGLMIGYKDFISETIKKKNVLGKRFFLVIPFSPFELGISTRSFRNLLAHSQGPLPFTQDYILKKVQTALFPKRDHLVRQAGRLGLKLRQLNNSEILELFYNIYHPDIQAIALKEEIPTSQP